MKLRDTRAGPHAGKGELRFGRVYAIDCGRGTPLDEHFGEGAVAAAHVEPSQPGCRSQPIEKRVADNLAPPPHVSFIASAIVEADLVSH
jgi:hypothetical protein